MNRISGRSVFWLSLAAVLVIGLAILALVVTNEASLSRQELPIHGRVSEFSFVDQDGIPFTRDSLLGKLSVVAFIFTRCPGACPIMMGQYQELYQGFSQASGIRFIGISVDPLYDSVSVLKRYSEELGILSPTGRFLHGPPDSVASLMENGFMLDAMNLPEGHSTKLVLVDGNAEIRGYYDGLDNASVDVLKSHLRELVKLYP